MTLEELINSVDRGEPDAMIVSGPLHLFVFPCSFDKLIVEADMLVKMLTQYIEIARQNKEVH